jgi:dephospho-CoA kinase
MKRLLKIAITGVSGSGKSLALEYLSEIGIPVLQTDRIGHQLLENNIFKKKIIKHFGKSVLGGNDKINRRYLALRVFNDPREQKKLNGLLHREIRKKVSEWVDHQAQIPASPPIVIVEVPLVFEGGYYRWFDGVLCVSASKQLREQRLLDRGWSSSEIFRRARAQWPQVQKIKMANWVISNQSTRKKMKINIRRWVNGMIPLRHGVISVSMAA